MNVLLLGATGLVGSNCLSGLIEREEIDVIRALSRRHVTVTHDKVSVKMVDFDCLGKDADCFNNIDVIICCLGTTLSKAGSRTAFKRVDHHYCLQAAKLGRKQGVTAFLLVSAMGASHRSPVFYSRVKGELERDLKALNYPVLSVFRPSLLLGRREDERLRERVASTVFSGIHPFFWGPMRKYKAIPAQTVAEAMIVETLKIERQIPESVERAHLNAQVNLYTYDEIVKLAEQ